MSMLKKLVLGCATVILIGQIGFGADNPGVVKQRLAFKIVREYVAANPNVQPFQIAGDGPGGKLGSPGSPCGDTFTQAKFLTDGIRPSMRADVGTGSLTDPNKYTYTMYEVVTDPNGDSVFEGSNTTTTENVKFPPEFGYIGFYRACPVVGTYTLEQFLFVEFKGLKLLGRNKCTFTVTP